MEPISLLKNNDGLELNNIEVIEKGLKVTSNESEIKININSVGHYNYLVFYHKDLLKDSKVIINSKGKTIEKELITSDINDTYKQEVIDISDIKDGAIITFTLKSNEDLIVLSDIVLY